MFLVLFINLYDFEPGGVFDHSFLTSQAKDKSFSLKFEAFRVLCILVVVLITSEESPMTSQNIFPNQLFHFLNSLLIVLYISIYLSQHQTSVPHACKKFHYHTLSESIHLGYGSLCSTTQLSDSRWKVGSQGGLKFIYS